MRHGFEVYGSRMQTSRPAYLKKNDPCQHVRDPRASNTSNHQMPLVEQMADYVCALLRLLGHEFGSSPGYAIERECAITPDSPGCRSAGVPRCGWRVGAHAAGLRNHTTPSLQSILLPTACSRPRQASPGQAQTQGSTHTPLCRLMDQAQARVLHTAKWKGAGWPSRGNGVLPASGAAGSRAAGLGQQEPEGSQRAARGQPEATLWPAVLSREQDLPSASRLKCAVLLGVPAKLSARPQLNSAWRARSRCMLSDGLADRLDGSAQPCTHPADGRRGSPTHPRGGAPRR